MKKQEDNNVAVLMRHKETRNKKEPTNKRESITYTIIGTLGNYTYNTAETSDKTNR